MKEVFKAGFKILKVIIWIGLVILMIGWHRDAMEAGKIYDKSEITKADIEKESSYKTATILADPDSGDFYYKIRKLSGVEHVGQIHLDDEEGVTVICSAGDVKILVMDEQGVQRFCQAATELQIYPGNAGTYDIYLVGKKYTGEMEIKY